MIREAKAADARARHEVFTESLGYVTTEDVVRRRIEELSGNDGTISIVFVDDATDEVCGFLHAMRYETLHSEGGWDVISLAVRPMRQGSGIGTALLKAAEDIMRGRGATYVRLNSRMERVSAHAFYDHRGYVCDKVQKRFIKHL